MAITTLTLSNPGAEDGNVAGWTVRSGSGLAAVTTSGGVTPRTGTYFFRAGAAASCKWDQQVSIPAELIAAVDAGTCEVRGYAYQSGAPVDNDSGALHLEAYGSDGTTLLGSRVNLQTNQDTWTQESVYLVLPVGTRFVRFGTTNVRAAGTNIEVAWDDFSLEISDNYTVDYISGAQVYSLGLEALVTAVPGAQIYTMGIEVLRSVTGGPFATPSGRRRIVFIPN